MTLLRPWSAAACHKRGRTISPPGRNDDPGSQVLDSSKRLADVIHPGRDRHLPALRYAREKFLYWFKSAALRAA